MSSFPDKYLIYIWILITVDDSLDKMIDEELLRGDLSGNWRSVIAAMWPSSPLRTAHGCAIPSRQRRAIDWWRTGRAHGESIGARLQHGSKATAAWSAHKFWTGGICVYVKRHHPDLPITRQWSKSVFRHKPFIWGRMRRELILRIPVIGAGVS